MAAVHQLPVREEGRFRLAARLLVETLRARPELHRVGAVVLGSGGSRMLAADRGASTRDVWTWVLERAEDLVRDEPRAAALVVPTIGGQILPTPWFDDVAAYDLNIWIVDREGRMQRSSFWCELEGGSLRAGAPRPEGPSSLDGVAALLAEILDDGPQRPAPGLRLVA